MAMRIHVVGAYGATAAQFREALNSIGDEGNGAEQFRFGSSGKWQWANASVWGVAGSEIDDAISLLPLPALRVTSSDGVLWMLTLTTSDRDRFRGVHHFTELESEEPEQYDDEYDDDDDDDSVDEFEDVAGINKFDPELQFLWDADEEARLKKQSAEEAEALVEGLDDYTDYGVTLPDGVIAEMKQHPNKASGMAFVAHGMQMVEALKEFGFAFEHDSMLKLLTAGPLTVFEADSDIGNMPRFLRTLGIDGVFSEESEDDEEPIDEEEDDEPDDYDDELDEEGVDLDASAEELAELTDMLQHMSEAVDRINEANVVPHSEEVIYEGRTGKFLRASMGDLEQIAQESLENHDATLASLGFQSIGDSVADVDQRQEITRCYSGHQQAIALFSHRNMSNQFGWAEVSDGAVMVDFSGGTNEFHTHFENGTSLVTTSIDAVTSKPEVGIYVRCYEDIPVTSLWKKHLDGIARFKKHHNTTTVDHAKFSEPAQFLEMIDTLFFRFMGMQ